MDALLDTLRDVLRAAETVRLRDIRRKTHYALTRHYADIRRAVAEAVGFGADAVASPLDPLIQQTQQWMEAGMGDLRSSSWVSAARQWCVSIGVLAAIAIILEETGAPQEAVMPMVTYRQALLLFASQHFEFVKRYPELRGEDLLLLRIMWRYLADDQHVEDLLWRALSQMTMHEHRARPLPSISPLTWIFTALAVRRECESPEVVQFLSLLPASIERYCLPEDAGMLIDRPSSRGKWTSPIAVAVEDSEESLCAGPALLECFGNLVKLQVLNNRLADAYQLARLAVSTEWDMYPSLKIVDHDAPTDEQSPVEVIKRIPEAWLYLTHAYLLLTLIVEGGRPMLRSAFANVSMELWHVSKRCYRELSDKATIDAGSTDTFAAQQRMTLARSSKQRLRTADGDETLYRERRRDSRDPGRYDQPKSRKPRQPTLKTSEAPLLTTMKALEFLDYATRSLSDDDRRKQLTMTGEEMGVVKLLNALRAEETHWDETFRTELVRLHLYPLVQALEPALYFHRLRSISRILSSITIGRLAECLNLEPGKALEEVKSLQASLVDDCTSVENSADGHPATAVLRMSRALRVTDHRNAHATWEKQAFDLSKRIADLITEDKDKSIQKEPEASRNVSS